MITYRCETWALKKSEKRKNCRGRDELLEKNGRKSYTKSWRKHVERMEEIRSPKQVLRYIPVGRKSRRRPRKKLIGILGSSSASSTLQQIDQMA